MAKKAAARPASTRTARTAPAAEGAHLDTSAGTDVNTDKRAEEARKDAEQRTKDASQRIVPARARSTEPFVQPHMVPATMIPAQTIGYVDPEEQAAAAAVPRRGIRVQAKAIGYYDDKLRRVGDVFTIDATENTEGKIVAFSDKWMRRVAPNTPERITKPNEAIAREHDVTQAERHGLELPADTAPNAEVVI